MRTSIRICGLSLFLLQTPSSYGENACKMGDTSLSICDDLGAYACKAGIISDGTGFSWRGMEEELEEKEYEELYRYAQEYFRKQLPDDKDLSKKMRKVCGKQLSGEALIECASKYALSMAMAPRQETLEDKWQRVMQPWRKRFLQNRSAKKTDKTLGDFYRAMEKRVVSPELSKTVKKSTEEVKSALISLVKRTNLSPADQLKMTEKIEEISFGGIVCDNEEFSSGSKMGPYLTQSAYYSPKQNSFYYCNGLERTNTSLFRRYFVIAHELAHSIDPHSFSVTEKDGPYSKLLNCLNGKNESNIASYRLDEAFADFVATEVVTQLMSDKDLTSEQFGRGFANVFRDGQACDEDDSLDFHLSEKKRLNKIVMMNPKVLELMDCPQRRFPTQLHYCGTVLGLRK